MTGLSSKNRKLKTILPATKLGYRLPPILWTAAIFFFSTDRFSGENTGELFGKIFRLIIPDLTGEQLRLINFMIRKGSHFTEYGILALLLFRAFRSGADTRWRWSWVVYTQLIVVIYALMDEYHQAFTRSRVGSAYDSLIDIAGGFTALSLLWLRRGRR